jgi:hypothetical protein
MPETRRVANKMTHHVFENIAVFCLSAVLFIEGLTKWRQYLAIKRIIAV